MTAFTRFPYAEINLYQSEGGAGTKKWVALQNFGSHSVALSRNTQGSVLPPGCGGRECLYNLDGTTPPASIFTMIAPMATPALSGMVAAVSACSRLLPPLLASRATCARREHPAQRSLSATFKLRSSCGQDPGLELRRCCGGVGRGLWRCIRGP